MMYRLCMFLPARLSDIDGISESSTARCSEPKRPALYQGCPTIQKSS